MKCRPDTKSRTKAYQSPSTRREWIEIVFGAPLFYYSMSPSTRREWIEIKLNKEFYAYYDVSLHTEGVD